MYCTVQTLFLSSHNVKRSRASEEHELQIREWMVRTVLKSAWGLNVKQVLDSNTFFFRTLCGRILCLVILEDVG